MIEPEHDYISIDIGRLRSTGYYTQNIQLDSGNYLMTFKYNHIDNSFTVDVADDDGPIYYGEPLILNQDLWRHITDPRLPEETLVMLSDNYDTHITLGNLNETVFLCIDNL